jgi:hypothetical protein
VLLRDVRIRRLAVLILAMCLMVTPTWAQESADDVSWNWAATPSSSAAGDSATIQVGLTNTGTDTWQAGGTDATQLGYIWLDADGNVLSWDTQGTPLADDVAPGSTVSEVLNVTNPGSPGDYTLRIGLVRDGGWFQTPTQDLLVLDQGVSISSPPGPPPEAAAPPAPTSTAPALHVSGNHIVNAANQPVTLIGVDRSDTANKCLHGQTNVAPMDEASVQAMRSWHINIVRIPLNEDCWFGISSLPDSTGAPYRDAMANYVQLLNQYGIVVILGDGELHLDSKGRAVLQDMPEATQAPRFWTSLAGAYKGNESVIFGLWGEPIPGTAADTTAAWTCLRDGGACPGLPVTGGGPSYKVAGMQQLVNTVRSTGADNILLVPGVRGDNILSHWLDYAPKDPLGRLVASWHSYPTLQCKTHSCWDSQIAPVAAKVPLIADEIGEGDCQHGYIDDVMGWLDAHQINYLAWTWWAGDCSATYSLISDYDGTPTNFGIGFRDHLLTLPGLT